MTRGYRGRWRGVLKTLLLICLALLILPGVILLAIMFNSSLLLAVAAICVVGVVGGCL